MWHRVAWAMAVWVSVGIDAGRAEPPTVPVAVVCPQSTFTEKLAAREVRRYVYLRTGKLLPIVSDIKSAPDGGLIMVGHGCRFADVPAVSALLQAGLAPDQYILKTVEHQGRCIVAVTGHGSTGPLYAAYRLAEHLGVRFYMHGDVVPERRITLKIPGLDEVGKPLFDRRGIQPFHDFPKDPTGGTPMPTRRFWRNCRRCE